MRIAELATFFVYRPSPKSWGLQKGIGKWRQRTMLHLDKLCGWGETERMVHGQRERVY